jgi:NitT/TauT family transport system permease protein
MSTAVRTAKAGNQTFDSLLIIAALFAMWQIFHWIAGDTAVSAPWPTVKYAFGLLQSPDFWPHVYSTLQAFALAYLIAIFGGLLIGLILGSNRLLAEIAEPMLIALYAVPKVTLYPIVLLFFGLGLGASVAFGALNGTVPVMIFTMNAVRNIKPVYIKTARVLRLGSARLMGTVMIPAALPEIFTGMRIGFSLALIGTLISEMFGSKLGLGNILMRAIGLNQVELIMGVTLLLVIFAAAANTVLLIIEGRLRSRI